MLNVRVPRTVRQVRAGTAVTAIAVAGAFALVGGHAAISPAVADAAPAENAEVAAGSFSPTPDEYQAAIARLEQKNAMFRSPATVGVAAAAEGWGEYIGRLVGEKAFGFGVQMGLDVLFTQLGVGDDTPQALSNIQSSIDALHGDVTDGFDSLENKIDWASFQDVEKEAQLRANGIANASKDIIKFAAGEEPGDQDLKDIYDASRGGIDDLKVYLLSETPVGSDGQVGTMPTLQVALAKSPENDAWDQIAAYRDYYRASLAQGLINLKWLEENGYDERLGHNMQVAMERAQEEASAIVHGLYNQVGVAYPQPVKFARWKAPKQIGSSISLKHTNPGTIYAGGSRPQLAGEDVAPMRTGDTVGTMYTQLKGHFDNGVFKNGRTFQQFLNAEGFPTTTHWANTFRIMSGVKGNPYAYVERKETRVQNGNIVDDKIGFGQDVVFWSTGYNASKAEAIAKAEPHMAEQYDAAQNHSPYRLDVSTNSRGYAISDDEDAVEMARSGLRVEHERSSARGDLGDITIENPGEYDTLLFLNAKTGFLLGSAGISDTVDAASFDRPQSGYVTVVLANAVPDKENAFVPMGSTVIPAGQGDNGKVGFSTISVVDQLGATYN